MSDPVEVAVVVCFGCESGGDWYWSIIDEKLNGRSGASGYGCKMDAVEDCVRAFRRELTDRVNDRMKQQGKVDCPKCRGTGNIDLSREPCSTSKVTCPQCNGAKWVDQ